MKNKLKNKVKKFMREQPDEMPTDTFSPSEGDDTAVVSTGSTLLDLAISGGRIPGGGIPAGIFVEAFGLPGTGKTVLLAQLAGSIQRQGGEILFLDPEARLNKQFVKMFGLDMSNAIYKLPKTVEDAFDVLNKWDPPKGKVNGVFIDSLAALSTKLEREAEDKYGMRRAKLFSENFRKFCTRITEENILLACSNQMREKTDAGQFEEKLTTPGGRAVSFYASLRLKFSSRGKVKVKKKFKGVEVPKTTGSTSHVTVYKSSVWEPLHEAPVSILYKYGIDDIRENLKFLKKFSNKSVYFIGDVDLNRSIETSIKMVEKQKLVKKLKKATIKLWHEIEAEFDDERQPKY